MWKTQWRPENEERPVENRDVGQTMTNGTTHRPSGAEETGFALCEVGATDDCEQRRDMVWLKC